MALASRLPRIDDLLSAVDHSLRTLGGAQSASRPTPVPAGPAPAELDDAQRRLSGALMRVNHVGEVCAQALYRGQRLATTDPRLARQLDAAAREEVDHLAWTRQRLDELGARPSVLNPLWYAGAFALGFIAGQRGDKTSLGFVVETERQVEQHLTDHLERLPAADTASRVIVEQMRSDESRHAADAAAAGGEPLPAPVRLLMRAASGVMTRVAHVI